MAWSSTQLRALLAHWDFSGWKRQPWKGLKSVVRMVSQRQIGETIEVQTRYFISSLPAKAKTILQAKRSHWKIENQVHWV